MTLLDVMNSPWAITPGKFADIQEVYQRHVRGEKLNAQEIESKIGALIPKAEDAPLFDVHHGVAIIPIEGVIAKKMNVLSRISGGASTELIGQHIREALNNSEVKAIVLKIDSPGGTVDGTQELATQIFEARTHKPIVAFTDGLMASAALWIGAAAQHIVLSGPTVEVGSIGVVATHTDLSRAQEMRGVKTTEIVSSKFKHAASPFKPLSESGEQLLQGTVDRIHEIFVGDIAKFRNTSRELVQTTMADGRVFLGQEAIAIGLVDDMLNLETLLGKLSRTTAHRQEDTMDDTTTPRTMTADEFAKHNPEAVEAWKLEGKNRGYTQGLEEGTTVGAEQERHRIQAVAAQFTGYPGHDTLAETLMYDGHTTGEQAAVQILEAERKLKADRAAALHQDAPAPITGTHTTTEPGGEASGDTAFDAAIDSYQKEQQCSLEKATEEVSKRPEFKALV